ncbi:TPA: hypothetical protein ACS72K_001090 [Providencia alcalifaciens]
MVYTTVSVDFNVNDKKYAKIERSIGYVERQIDRLKKDASDFYEIVEREGGEERLFQYNELMAAIYRYEMLLVQMKENNDADKNYISDNLVLKFNSEEEFNQRLEISEKDNNKIQMLERNSIKFKNKYLPSEIEFDIKKQSSFDEKALTIRIDNRIRQTNYAIQEVRSLSFVRMYDYNNAIGNEKYPMHKDKVYIYPSHSSILRERMSGFTPVNESNASSSIDTPLVDQKPISNIHACNGRTLTCGITH